MEGLLEGVLVSIDQHDLCTLDGASVGDRRSDALRRAGDDDDLRRQPLEPEIATMLDCITHASSVDSRKLISVPRPVVP